MRNPASASRPAAHREAQIRAAPMAGGGGMLLGQKISDRVAAMRTLPPGIDQRSACRHPDWTGPDDLAIKILELREITDSGGIRTGADVAKAMALGADAVAIGTAALIALGDNHPRYAMEYAALGSAAGFYDDFQDGRDPAGITTQHPELAARLVVDPRRDALIDVRVDVAAVADRRAEDVRGGSRP